MKFAHNFDTSLREGNYPSTWLETAISYRQLKKCIKLVQRELREIGLGPEVLEHLWQLSTKGGEEASYDHNAHETPSEQCKDHLAQHTAGRADEAESKRSGAPGQTSKFEPKLTVVVDPRDGSPIDAWLSPETKQFLVRFSRSRTEDSLSSQTNGSQPCEQSDLQSSLVPPDNGESLKRQAVGTREHAQMVEVPLTSGTEFFRILQQELRGLGQLQETQQRSLNSQIVKLGEDLAILIESGSRKSKADLVTWREIFGRYLEAQVFFSTLDARTGYQSSQSAQRKLQQYGQSLESDRQNLKLSERGKTALVSFLQINTSLLQFMKYQDINRLALTKILKKFDKRTSLLHTQPGSNLPLVLSREAFVAQDVAKAACATIQDQLLPVVPQLTDYLCPVCLTISFKPIRLKCNHVFCIRCIILLKRQRKDKCPMCRDDVVLLASTGKPPSRSSPYTTGSTSLTVIFQTTSTQL